MKDLINRLRAYASTRKGELSELITEAADALERQTCEDAVSRQAAIDAIKHSELDFEVDAIEQLPSVQPQQTCEYWDSESKFCALCRQSSQPEITYCKDCAFSHRYIDFDGSNWIECQNPNGLNRDVSGDGYCYAGAERRTDEQIR